MLATYLSSKPPRAGLSRVALAPAVAEVWLGVCFGLFLGTAGCSPSTPATPTWAEDVAPILAANCVRCHTVPAIGGAPETFRLDTYDDWTGDDGRVIRGAGTMSSYILQRIDPGPGVPPMPPEEGFARLTSRQIDVLSNWANNIGADLRAERGAPRDGNEAPAMTVTLVDRDADTVAIDYNIDDPDHDIVTGDLIVGASVDGGVVISRELHSGNGTVLWDVGAFAAGSYTIFAVLRDTSGSHEIDLGSRDVTTGNTAPTATVRNLGRNSLISSTEATTFGIEINVQDADFMLGQTLDLDVTATLGDTMVTVATGQAAVIGTNIVTWDLTGVPAGARWRLQVTVSDGGDSRTVEAGPFILGDAVTTDTFTTMTDDFFAVYCNFCHPAASIPGLTHNFTQYQAAAGDDILGVRELRGEIFRRVIEQRNMPPASIPTFVDPLVVERLESWLLAGAPE